MQIGMTARDKYTGFTGLVTGKVEYLTGCTQFLLQPYGLDKDGKPMEAIWMDQDRVEAITAEEMEVGSPGGPGPEPGKR